MMIAATSNALQPMPLARRKRADGPPKRQRRACKNLQLHTLRALRWGAKTEGLKLLVARSRGIWAGLQGEE
jgi:hypothetical protein